MITGYIEEYLPKVEEDTPDQVSDVSPAQPEAVHYTPKDYGCFRDVDFVIPRGTPYVLKFNIKDFKDWMRATKGNWFWNRLKNGDKALFGIKKHPDDSDYIYTRIVEVDFGYAENEYGNLVDAELGEMTSHGAIKILLNESDTDIEPGMYYYSVAALVSEKKNNEYKEPYFVEITPPVPFRIRPMMISLTDMCDEYARLIAETEEKIAALRAKTQTQGIESEILSLTRLKWDYQIAMRKIQKKIDEGVT